MDAHPRDDIEAMRFPLLLLAPLLVLGGCSPTAAPHAAAGGCPPPGSPPTVATGAEFLPRGPAIFGGFPFMHFTSPRVAWRIAGPTVYRSSDAGLTWRAVLDTNSYKSRWDGYSWFFDDRRAVVLGGTVADGFYIFRTTDAGASWQESSTPPGALVGIAMELFSFSSPDNGWFLTESGAYPTAPKTLSLYGTTDGGLHWRVLTQSDTHPSSGHLPLDMSLNHLLFATASKGWVTGQITSGPRARETVVYLTTDGGRTWQRQHLPPAQGEDVSKATAEGPVIDAAGTVVLPVVVNLPPPGKAPIGDGDQAARVALYGSPDGGTTWACPALWPRPSDVTRTGGLLDASHWWLTGTRDLWTTSDAGRTWVHLQPVLPAVAALVAVDFASPGYGFADAVTSAPGTEPLQYSYLQTTDGGLTWVPAPSIPGEGL